MRELNPSIDYNVTLANLFSRQLDMIKKKMLLVHEDLRYDFELELESLA